MTPSLNRTTLAVFKRRNNFLLYASKDHFTKALKQKNPRLEAGGLNRGIINYLKKFLDLLKKSGRAAWAISMMGVGQKPKVTVDTIQTTKMIFSMRFISMGDGSLASTMRACRTT